jgi:hypothetical protein
VAVQVQKRRSRRDGLIAEPVDLQCLVAIVSYNAAVGSEGLTPLLARPYAERQRIIVVDDEAARALASGHAADVEPTPAARESSNFSLAKLAAFGTVGILTRDPVLIGVALLNSAPEGTTPTPTTSMLAVGRTEAQSLTLPPGHPRDRVVYIGHPIVPTTYYPAAAFHRFAFEDKFAEAIRLLMSLGATSIEVEHVRGWSDEFAADIAVPLPAAGKVEIGGRADKQHSKGSSLLFRATLAGSTEPMIPEDLVWYPHEPTWRRVAEGRTRYGMREFELSVRYDDDYGIDARFKLAVQKVGLDLGGKFQEHEATTWKINGSFDPQAN